MTITTAWNNPTRPSSTPYTSRVKPGDWTYYTWGNAPDTWGSANQTWGEYGFGMANTNWTNPR